MREPDLDQVGKPLEGKAFAADGTWAPFQIPQTKRDNCAAAAHEAGGLKDVTPEILDKWDVTEAECAAFAMDHAVALRSMETHRQFSEIMMREFPPGPPDRDEYVRQLQKLMPNDWQKHLPPE